jgi:hypothetical protein
MKCLLASSRLSPYLSVHAFASSDQKSTEQMFMRFNLLEPKTYFMYHQF